MALKNNQNHEHGMVKDGIRLFRSRETGWLISDKDRSDGYLPLPSFEPIAKLDAKKTS